MHPNPFSPSFSVRPQDFYGRETYLAQFAETLDNPGSANRYLLLTGTRGCGKTSLLHQYALLARGRGWDVLETTSIDALGVLACYVGLDRGVDGSGSMSPRASVATMAFASLGEAKARGASDGATSLLGPRLTERLCYLKAKRGLLIIIDEAQAIGYEHMVCICNVVQTATAEGADIALVLGGLPVAYSRIRSFKEYKGRVRHGNSGVDDGNARIAGAYQSWGRGLATDGVMGANGAIWHERSGRANGTFTGRPCTAAVCR